MTLLQVYTARAAECRREADAATLVNVRDRHLGAALAWENMAYRVQLTESYRADNEAGKAEERERQAKLR
jgi:hypothetical protein